MYAVIETGGKQYRVEVGTELAVELLDAEPGQAITLDRVLLVADGSEASIGRPLVGGATVAAEVVRRDRAEKLIAFKYRPKARRRVKKGHRQEQTILRITDVVLDGKSAAEAARKAEQDALTERQRLEDAAARQAAQDAALAAKLAARDAKPETAEAAPAAPAKRRASKAGSTGETAGTSAKGAADAAKPAAKTVAKPVAKTPRAKAAPSESASPAPRRSRTKKDE